MASWDPFVDGFRIVERFGGRFRGGWPFDGDVDAESGDDATTPPTDIFRDREGDTHEVELPGVAARDVSVSLVGDRIVVEADRTFSHARGRAVLSLEGRYGRLRRDIPLPYGAHVEGIVVELKAGVLRIFVPHDAARSTVTRPVEVRDVDRPVELELEL